MKEYTFEGRTLEDALLKASETLGINIRDMDYEVTEQETRMFGLVKKMIVKVNVPDDLKLPADEDEDFVPETPSVEEPVQVQDSEIKGNVETVIARIVELMGMDVTMSLQETQSEVLVDISSPDIDYLIGKDGRVLTSLQFIVNRIVNRKAETRKHVLIDAGGYKEKREERLQEKAQELARRAVESGEVIRMGTMNARDRRIVHLALKDVNEVSTRSEGDGAKRRVVIIPKNRKSGRRGQNGGRKKGRRQAQSAPERGMENAAKD